MKTKNGAAPPERGLHKGDNEQKLGLGQSPPALEILRVINKQA